MATIYADSKECSIEDIAAIPADKQMPAIIQIRKGNVNIELVAILGDDYYRCYECTYVGDGEHIKRRANVLSLDLLDAIQTHVDRLNAN
uniref:Uncharacterized protein n=1 Tax=viral metagenome TaxID=1070528 RepID=A0A6C0K1F3_9ZZZZ